MGRAGCCFHDFHGSSSGPGWVDFLHSKPKYTHWKSLPTLVLVITIEQNDQRQQLITTRFQCLEALKFPRSVYELALRSERTTFHSPLQGHLSRCIDHKSRIVFVEYVHTSQSTSNTLVLLASNFRKQPSCVTRFHFHLSTTEHYLYSLLITVSKHVLGSHAPLRRSGRGSGGTSPDTVFEREVSSRSWCCWSWWLLWLMCLRIGSGCG